MILPMSEIGLTVLENNPFMRMNYPKELKRKARKLVRLGIPRLDVSKMLKVGISAVYMWTRDMKGQQGRSGIRASL